MHHNHLNPAHGTARKNDNSWTRNEKTIPVTRIISNPTYKIISIPARTEISSHNSNNIVIILYFCLLLYNSRYPAAKDFFQPGAQIILLTTTPKQTMRSLTKITSKFTTKQIWSVSVSVSVCQSSVSHSFVKVINNQSKLSVSMRNIHTVTTWLLRSRAKIEKKPLKLSLFAIVSNYNEIELRQTLHFQLIQFKW